MDASDLVCRYDFNDAVGLKWQGQFSKDPDIAHQMLDLDLTVNKTPLCPFLMP